MVPLLTDSKIIRRADEIPDWFDLDNYSSVETFGIREWRNELVHRVVTETLIEIRDDGVKHEAVENELDEEMACIRRRPTGQRRGLRRAKGKMMAREARTAFTPVQELTVYEAFCIADDRKKWEQWKEACEAQEDGKESAEQRKLVTSTYEANLLADGVDSGLSFLTVELWVTDEHLTQAFKTWLDGRRKTTGPSTNDRAFTEKDFQAWSRWQVLPYIDLTLWSKFCRTRIGLAAMGETLFPNETEVDTTDRVRRTTKRRADWLMRDEIQIALGNQAKANPN